MDDATEANGALRVVPGKPADALSAARLRVGALDGSEILPDPMPLLDHSEDVVNPTGEAAGDPQAPGNSSGWRHNPMEHWEDSVLVPGQYTRNLPLLVGLFCGINL